MGTAQINYKNSPKFSEADRDPSVEIKNFPVKIDDTPVEKGGCPVLSGKKVPRTHIPTESRGIPCCHCGDWVYYKAYQLLSAEKCFNAGFVPKLFGLVKLMK